jgi:hypothetical protein
MGGSLTSKVYDSHWLTSIKIDHKQCTSRNTQQTVSIFKQLAEMQIVIFSNTVEPLTSGQQGRTLI